jgi:hypothetical protein
VKTKAEYDRIFDTERAKVYPEIDDLETRLGYAVSRERLEAAARALACPLKVNPPSWQHGRVIYALLRKRLEQPVLSNSVVLDIGTAKGFSSVVAGWAIEDAGAKLEVLSVDVVEPEARVPRNSVAELDGLKTVSEFVAPFCSTSVRTTYLSGGSEKLLKKVVEAGSRVPFAFVDGKHSFGAVANDARMLARIQVIDDVVLFDDVQIDAVLDGVRSAAQFYATKRILSGERRAYMVGTRS